MSGLGFGARAERLAELERRARERRARLSVRYDSLLEMSAFREFLDDLADAGRFLAERPCPSDEWEQGRVSALRSIVDDVVVNSSRGAEWLREYAVKRAAGGEVPRKTEKTEETER